MTSHSAGLINLLISVRQKVAFLFPILGFTEETKNRLTTFQSDSKLAESNHYSPATVKTEAITVAAVSIR